MQIDDRNEQSAKAKTAMDESAEPDSNTTLEMRPSKQAEHKGLRTAPFGIVTTDACPK
jgi:hypothetical protein